MTARKCQGFSLLEIMLVLALLGGMASLAIGMLPDRPSLRVEENKLLSRLQWASEQAVQNGQVYGLVVTKTEWQVVRLTRASKGEQTSDYWPGRYWQAIRDAGRPSVHRLAENVGLRLLLNGTEQTLAPSLHDARFEPQILLMPGGESSRFAIHLSAEGQTSQVVTYTHGVAR
ncbi:GspH/FimT family pseudopilin [Enterobacter cloacae]|uniref:GspH/FimT family pseudopilin n=1 Tax=Enterobacter cloacae TaxID=550 RepID=UPI00101AF8B3|nr:GspH/FimT family pseudopilin [Enterobacter cloacae]QBC03374.1 type II secretion system protein GspH [Enterobacter cloacae]